MVKGNKHTHHLHKNCDFFTTLMDTIFALFVNAKHDADDTPQYTRAIILLSDILITGLINRLITNLISSRAYFRYLLHAVSTRNALFEFLLVFSYSKNFKFTCCLGGFICELS